MENNVSFSEDKVYGLLKNVTANKKVVIASLGMEIAPGQTVNLREIYRKSQIIEAGQQIFFFVNAKVLDDLEAKNNNGTEQKEQPEPAKADISAMYKQKLEEAKQRGQVTAPATDQKPALAVNISNKMKEIEGTSSLSVLEDILTDPKENAELKAVAKIKYMQMRGWVDDDGVTLIPGSSDDDNNEILSIKDWEFKPLNLSALSEKQPII